MRKAVRQGDVLIWPVDAIPATAVEVAPHADRLTVAHGEATGSVGLASDLGAPLVQHEIAVDPGVGFLGPVVAKHRSLRAPVSFLPEPPVLEADDGGMAEGKDQNITNKEK